MSDSEVNEAALLREVGELQELLNNADNYLRFLEAKTKFGNVTLSLINELHSERLALAERITMAGSYFSLHNVSKSKKLLEGRFNSQDRVEITQTCSDENNGVSPEAVQVTECLASHVNLQDNQMSLDSQLQMELDDVRRCYAVDWVPSERKLIAMLPERGLVVQLLVDLDLKKRLLCIRGDSVTPQDIDDFEKRDAPLQPHDSLKAWITNIFLRFKYAD